MHKSLLAVTSLLSSFAVAQFPGPVGDPGTTAMSGDSSAFVAWAKQCHVIRGPQDISNPSLGVTTVGDSSLVPGKADAGVVSLGDGGSAIVTFSAPITNGAGYDFAVFENAFNDSFLELGFVEVSSDGVNFFRFPAASNSPASPQYGNSAMMDASKLDNLAGKYRALYGTPFDLQQLSGNPQLNINAITHVKIIDVVGSIDPSYARYDKNNNVINDPWPTAFASGGFDLDAVGVIHQAATGIHEINDNSLYAVYPNPFEGILNIRCSDVDKEGICHVKITNTLAETVMESDLSAEFTTIDLSVCKAGIYFITIESRASCTIKKLIKN